MKKICFFLCFFSISFFILAEEVRPVKNVIMMIPDGTSPSVYSASRWFKHYKGLGERLHIDPYLSGTVTTHSSHAPIGDSAPTGSTYATGVLQRVGNVAIYPEASENDIYPVDESRTYQPAATILEASKIEKGKAVGLVVTCEFPHATPADFSSHHYKRGAYNEIASQIAHQNLDVMFGGGTSFLTDDIKQHFTRNGTVLIQDDREALLNYSGNEKVWALFGSKAPLYNIDRDPDKVPSLAEMTGKALELLSKNENGFFLMVEGSQIDWAAHANDPATIISEFLAFDEAVREVMEFALEDGNTAVVIASDHGTSGMSIGSRHRSGSSRLSLEDLFGTVSKYRLSAQALESMVEKSKPDEVKNIFKKYTGIDLTDEELKTILSSKNYKEADYTQVATSNNLAHNIVSVLNSKTYFGFPSGSHTGEEVLLASYHPLGDLLKGNVKNTELNKYLQQVTGLDVSLQEYSDRLFAKHTDVFKGTSYAIDRSNPDFPVLRVQKGRNNLEIKAFSSIAKRNGQSFDIGSVVVYIDKNDTFYLPIHLMEKL